MLTFTVDRHIAAPATDVFACAADLRNAPAMISAITRLDVLTDGPIGSGTRFRETRRMFNREATEEMTIGGFDPPNGYSVDCENHGCRYHSEFRFTPDAGGTKATFVFEATPLTLWARVMGVVMRPMMKSAVKSCAKDLDDLKAYVEARRSPSPALRAG
jgi:hypothetical protein